MYVKDLRVITGRDPEGIILVDNASYSFGLLSGFYSKEGVEKFKKAILFFDKVKKAVAFAFTNDDNAEGAFAISHGSNNGSISARSFFIENEILRNDKFLGKKNPKKVKDDRLGTLYVIDLMENLNNNAESK